MARKDQHVVSGPMVGRCAAPATRRTPRITAPRPKQEVAAREIARNQRSDVVTHGRDGRIRSKDSYGNDPNPPRDKEH